MQTSTQDISFWRNYIKERGQSVEIVNVTPDMAKLWLELNRDNRPMRESKVKSYARDMAAGRWRYNNHGIGFYKSGDLADGQHRLAAAVMSGSTLELQVTFGLTRQEGETIDQGLIRTVSDLAGCSARGAAIAHRVMRGIDDSYTPYTRLEQVAAYKKHRDAVEFALGFFPHPLPRLSTAGVLAVIARAYYTVDHSRLERFCEVLRDGLIANAKESACITLRNWLLSRATVAGDSVQTETYRKTERALDAFLKGEALGKAYASQIELFPV